MTITLEECIGIATFCVAVFVAVQARQIAKSAEKLTQASNNISFEANRIEAEKVLIAWSQRVAARISAATG
ncbi:MAG: hypothetical protein AB3N22_05105 [Ruegeria sp.]